MKKLTRPTKTLAVLFALTLFPVSTPNRYFAHPTPISVLAQSVQIKPVEALPELEAKPIATIAPKAVPRPVKTAQKGGCTDWMKQAGIPNSHAANQLIVGESGCQVGRLNTSSYACGIGQSWPCTKMYPHATIDWINKNKFQVNNKWFIPGDALTELRWMKEYIMNRYGSFEKAYSAWLNRNPHWY